MAFAQITKEEVLERIDPRSFYNHELNRLGEPNNKGWAQAVCPFHNDTNPVAVSEPSRRDTFTVSAATQRVRVFDFLRAKGTTPIFPRRCVDLGEIAGIR